MDYFIWNSGYEKAKLIFGNKEKTTKTTIVNI